MKNVKVIQYIKVFALYVRIQFVIIVLDMNQMNTVKMVHVVYKGKLNVCLIKIVIDIFNQLIMRKKYYHINRLLFHLLFL